MPMKSIYSIIFLFTYIFSNTQIGPPLRPFEKIHFTGVDRIWHEVSYYQNENKDFYDGYNQLNTIEALDPVIYDEKIFTSYLQIGPNGAFYGGYLECRDLNKGTLLWSHGYGHHTGGHQEVTRLMYIENGQLVTINQLNKDAYDINYEKRYYPRMIISKRIYNIDSGGILSYTHRSFDDPKAHETNYNYYLFSRNFSFYREGKNIRYIYQGFVNNENIVKSVLLDATGAFISIDSLEYTDLSYYFNFTQLHKDTLLSIQFMDDPYSLIFHYLSPDLKLYKTVTSPYVFDKLPGYNWLESISKDKTKLLFNNSRNDSYPNSYPEVFVFDVRSGELLHKVSIKSTINKSGYKIMNWEEPQDSLIFIYGRIQDDLQSDKLYSRLNFFKVGHVDSLVMEREYLPKDTLRCVIPYHTIKLTNEKYLIYFAELGLTTNAITNKINGYDQNGRAFSMMLLDMNSLGLISSASESIPVHADFSLFPNPSSGIITIHTAVPFSGDVLISDISGCPIVNHPQIEIGSYGLTIDLSKFESGMYIVHFLSKNGEHIVKKVVKM